MKGKCWHLPFLIAISSVGFNTAHAELTVLPGETYTNINTSLEVLDLLDNQGTFFNLDVSKNK